MCAEAAGGFREFAGKGAGRLHALADGGACLVIRAGWHRQEEERQVKLSRARVGALVALEIVADFVVGDAQRAEFGFDFSFAKPADEEVFPLAAEFWILIEAEFAGLFQSDEALDTGIEKRVEIRSRGIALTAEEVDLRLQLAEADLPLSDLDSHRVLLILGGVFLRWIGRLARCGKQGYDGERGANKASRFPYAGTPHDGIGSEFHAVDQSFRFTRTRM